jgi:hypothetical protein
VNEESIGSHVGNERVQRKILSDEPAYEFDSVRYSIKTNMGVLENVVKINTKSTEVLND